MFTSISFCANGKFFNCVPKYVPKPSFSREITKAFDSFKFNNFDESFNYCNVVGLWLLVELFFRIGSVHDGGSQRSPKTFLVANSLTSISQNNSFDIIKYLVSSKMSKIKNDTSLNYETFMSKIKIQRI